MSTAVATVVVGVLSLIGTLAGSYGGIKLMTYRIEQLEKRVEKHNNLIERTYKLEEEQKVQEEQIKVANHRIDDLEKEVAR
jgi:sensor histidine kinase YesM